MPSTQTSHSFFFCSFPFSTLQSFTTEQLANAAHCNTFDCLFLNENHRRCDDKWMRLKVTCRSSLYVYNTERCSWFLTNQEWKCRHGLKDDISWQLKSLFEPLHKTFFFPLRVLIIARCLQPGSKLICWAAFAEHKYWSAISTSAGMFFRMTGIKFAENCFFSPSFYLVEKYAWKTECCYGNADSASISWLPPQSGDALTKHSTHRWTSYMGALADCSTISAPLTLPSLSGELLARAVPLVITPWF